MLYYNNVYTRLVNFWPLVGLNGPMFSVDFDMYKPFLSFLGLNSATKCLSAKIAIGRFL